jgi:nicotinate-nucleotide adenylyltransferase
VGRRVSPASVLLRPGRTASLGPADASGSRAQSLEPEAQRSDPAGVPRRIGILGGTFDPPHVGHLWLATLAADAFALDRVVFMPAARPPHKGGRRVTSAAHRLLMTRLAIAGNPLFELSAVEMERPGPSFTIDSVEELRELYAGIALYLVMAADSLAQIDTWREPDRLLSLIEWIVGPRPGTPIPRAEQLAERFGTAAARIHLLDGPALDVSASEIRGRVAAGRAIRYLVPRAVEELILDQRLYHGPTRTRRS